MNTMRTTRRTGGRPWLGYALALGLALVAQPSWAQTGKIAPPTPNTGETTREAMQELFAQLQILLPAAVQEELGAPERAKEIKDAFDRMQRRVDALPEHGKGLDPGARLFGRALSRDVKRARYFFERGRFENAAFIVESLVDDCTACHTRRKADDALITQAFVTTDALKELDTLQLASIAVATRRFEDGMTRYEQGFREPDVVPGVMLGPLIRYLTVTLRVARDPERAHKTISEFASRPDISETVRSDVEHWKKVLDTLSSSDLKGKTLDRARKATQTADELARYPGDQRTLIEYLIASSQLHDLAALPQESPDAAAEIYELAGRAELGVAQSVAVSRADLYWETAIRLAPKSPAALRAFALLEEETMAGFTGSGGLQLPEEEEARLDELRALIAGTGGTSRDGAQLFADHCALCHGADAEGRGVVSPQLMWSPADLTRIASRRGGTFPAREVFELIARRDPLGNHQSPEMPRWGKYWKDDSKIDALVGYLQSIQQP